MLRVWKDIDALGIDVFECPYKSYAAISSQDGFIGYDPQKIKTTAELNAVLSHEVGHFISGTFYHPYSKLTLRGKAEYKANKAATYHYIPYDELVACFQRGIVERWELAEHFDVTEDFISTALEIYRASK